MAQNHSPEDFIKALDSFFYPPFNTPFQMKYLTFEEKKVVYLQNMQRSIGLVKGEIKKFDPATEKGTIKIDGATWEFLDKQLPLSRKNLADFVGQKKFFSFWPALEQIPKGKLKKLPYLKISNAYQIEFPEENYVESIGRLEKIWPKQFLLLHYSPVVEQFFYTVLTGKYPRPEEEGKFVWVTGSFESKSQVIQFKKATLLDFMPEEKEKELKKNINHVSLADKMTRYKDKDSYPPSDYCPVAFTQPKTPVIEISLDEIMLPGKEQYKFNAEKLEKLRKKMDKLGEAPKPIIVKETKEQKYIVLDGLRRVIVALEQKHKAIKAQII